MATVAEQFETNKEIGAEVSRGTGPTPAGLWRHPQSGQEAVTLSDPIFGDTQSEAFARLGFVRVGDAPEGYVKHMTMPSNDFAAQPQRQVEANQEDLRGLQARLSALEAENEKLKNPARPESTQLGAEETKQAAADNVANRTETEPVDVSTGRVGTGQDEGEVSQEDPAGEAEAKPSGEDQGMVQGEAAPSEAQKSKSQMRREAEMNKKGTK